MEGNQIEYRLYLYIYVLCNILKLENIFNMVFNFIGILCLIYDLDIDL